MPAPLPDGEAVRLADLNYAASFREMARHAAGGSGHEEQGLVAAITGPIPWLNVTIVHEELADPVGAISRVMEFYRDAEVGFVIRIRVGFGMATQHAMKELGLETAARLPGMILNPVSDPPTVPDGLTIADWSAASLSSYNEVMAASFGAPLD